MGSTDVCFISKKRKLATAGNRTRAKRVAARTHHHDLHLELATVLSYTLNYVPSKSKKEKTKFIWSTGCGAPVQIGSFWAKNARRPLCELLQPLNPALREEEPDAYAMFWQKERVKGRREERERRKKKNQESLYLRKPNSLQLRGLNKTSARESNPSLREQSPREITTRPAAHGMLTCTNVFMVLSSRNFA